MNIGIVTDSTADISPSLASDYGIHCVPAILVMDGQSYIDGEGITREAFYQKLPHMTTAPTTATPSDGIFEQAYHKLFEQGVEHILSIHPPSSLSGLLDTARIAAQKFGDRITVLDSGFVTLGSGFQAIAAAEAAHHHRTLAEILAVVQNIRQRTHLVAMLDTLEYIRRSGRVSWARASLGSLLQLKPFIGLKDGKVLRMGEARTRNHGIQRLYDHLRKLGHLDRLAILHTNAENDAHEMVNEFSEQAKSPPLVVNVTSVIGTHVGPNGLGFVAVVE